jgi:hypothetical protein
MVIRHSAILTTILLLTGLALAPQVASADVVTMTLTGPPPGPSAYGIYLSPYTATINGISGISVICDDFLDESVKGASWTATAIAGSGDLSGTRMAAKRTDGGDLNRDYDAIAYLLPLLETDRALYSFAIWHIFAPAAVDSWLAGAGSFRTNVDNAAANALINAPVGARDYLTIYSPVTTGSTPQEFVIDPVPTPEASTTAILFAEFFASLGGLILVRRRIRQAN